MPFTSRVSRNPSIVDRLEPHPTFGSLGVENSGSPRGVIWSADQESF